jgi:RNA polymerase sigma-70 factor (ECF subfamily)
MDSNWRESDLELVRRMLDGDEEAFERFFDVAYPVLYRFALVRLTFDREAAADIAQTAICKAIRKLHTFRGEAALLTWACTICRHELYAWERRHRVRLDIELAEDQPEIRAALESLRTAADDPDVSLDRSGVAALVQRVLDHLPPRYAEVLECKYIDEMPVHDIGVRLGLGTKAAESLLTRARRAFREAFEAIAPVWPGLGRVENRSDGHD